MAAIFSVAVLALAVTTSVPATNWSGFTLDVWREAHFKLVRTIDLELTVNDKLVSKRGKSCACKVQVGTYVGTILNSLLECSLFLEQVIRETLARLKNALSIDFDDIGVTA